MASITAYWSGPLRTARDHPSLITVTATEVARLRHGFLLWYVLLAPVAIAIPLYLGSLFSPEGASGHTWDTFSNVSFEFWGTLVPMTAGLTAALAVRADEDALRLLLSYAVPRWRYLAGKFLALAFLSLVSTTIFAVLLAFGAAINGQLDDLGLVASGSFLPWVAGLASMAIALVVAMLWGTGPAIAAGVVGLLSGALIADKAFWMLVPFAWPMRVILPLAGIGANGIALPDDSPLRDTSVIGVAVMLSLLVTAAVLAAGTWYVNRQEV